MRKLRVCALFCVMCMFAAIGLACGREDDYDPNKVNITVWVQNPQYEFFVAAAESFETANEDINIRIIAQPENNLGTSLDATLGTSSRPDIFSTYGGLVAGTLNKSGHLLNLDDVILPIEDNLVGAAKSNKIDGNGHYVTAPLHGFASPVIFYNKTMFQAMKQSNSLTQVQKDAIKEPATYAEFKALCDAITAYGKTTVVGGFSTWHLPHFMQAIHSRSMTVQNYAKLLDRNAAPNPFLDPGYEAGFALLKKYYDDGILVEGIGGYTVDTANTMFYNDQAVMRVGVSLDYASLNENVTFDLGAFFLPKESDNLSAPRANGLYGDVIAVAKKTSYPAECKLFIQHVMSAEVQASLADYSLFPSRADANIAGKLPSTLQGIFDEMGNGCNDFYQSWSYPATDIAVLEAGTSVLGGSKTFAQAAKIVADFFDEAKAAANQ